MNRLFVGNFTDEVDRVVGNADQIRFIVEERNDVHRFSGRDRYGRDDAQKLIAFSDIFIHAALHEVDDRVHAGDDDGEDKDHADKKPKRRCGPLCCGG